MTVKPIRPQRTTPTLLAACGLLAAGPAARAAYTILDLGTLGGSTSSALDVNNRTVASGTSLVASDPGSTGSLLRAFAWSPTSGIAGLGALPSTAYDTSNNRYSRGYGLNDAGVVVGEFNNNGSRAFVYDPAVGRMVGLTRLMGGTDNGVAMDVNNAGVIVGVSAAASGASTVSRATRWTLQGGTYVPADLGSADGLTATAARANAVNGRGDAAGYSRNAVATSPQATLWAGGTATPLGSLGTGLQYSQANGLNDADVVVGYSYKGTVGDLKGTTSTTDLQRAFSWQAGVMTELVPANAYSAANPTGNVHSVAQDVSNAGLVVGNSQVTQGVAAVATLWQNGVPTDLNTLLPAGSGWNLLSAEGVNDRGDIAGYGTINGVQHAFILAVPEPASAAALGSAAAAGLLGRRRQVRRR